VKQAEVETTSAKPEQIQAAAQTNQSVGEQTAQQSGNEQAAAQTRDAVVSEEPKVVDVEPKLKSDKPKAQHAATRPVVAAAASQASHAQAGDPSQSQGLPAQTAGQDEQVSAQPKEQNQAQTQAAPIQTAATQASAASTHTAASTTEPVATPVVTAGPVTSITNTGQAAPSGPVPLPELPQADTQSQQTDQLNTARLTRGLQNALQQRGGALTLRLTPPDMGTVRIQLHVHGATVTANFQAETESARSLLTNQMAQLRHALESHGLTVDRLSVQSSNSNSSSAFGNQADESSAEGRSRGEYARQQGGHADAQQHENETSAFEQMVLNERP
jgi:flagellar hook-length control protein FliK